MEVLRAILCRRFQQTGPNAYEYTSAFRELVVGSFPKHGAEVALLAEVRREPTESSQPIVVMVVNGRGERVSETDIFKPLDSQDGAEHPTWSLAVQFRNVTLAEPGTYRVRLSLAGELLWEEEFAARLRRP